MPRTGTGKERVILFMDRIEKALTAPLTDEEKASGLYAPPPPSRIFFKGTLSDAHKFYQQTTPIENGRGCPMAKYTDGLPIVVPTEERVKEMLIGTSHSPGEVIKYFSDVSGTALYRAAHISGHVAGKKGETVTYSGAYRTTVEKVATVAVMAGCKSEDLPVALAIATAGGGSTACPLTSGPDMWAYAVSGPIAKEIGMNVGQGAFDVGNPANNCLGRSAALMTINFGNCITGIARTAGGNPVNKGLCFAEDEEGLPPGWETLREDKGNYGKDESMLVRFGHPFMRMTMGEYAPSSFRGLIGEGYGGMARRMGVEGIPGPHNFLEYVCPLLIPSGANVCLGYVTFVMSPNMAKSLYEYGFKKKADVYKWLWEAYFITHAELKKYGWYDFITGAGEKIEPISGQKYKDLPDDHELHVFGVEGPEENCIIVSNGFSDEVCYSFQGATYTVYPIDVWR